MHIRFRNINNRMQLPRPIEVRRVVYDSKRKLVPETAEQIANALSPQGRSWADKVFLM